VWRVAIRPDPEYSTLRRAGNNSSGPPLIPPDQPHEAALQAIVAGPLVGSVHVHKRPPTRSGYDPDTMLWV
jgi:hypothetical protein